MPISDELFIDITSLKTRCGLSVFIGGKLSTYHGPAIAIPNAEAVSVQLSFRIFRLGPTCFQ